MNELQLSNDLTTIEKEIKITKLKNKLLRDTGHCEICENNFLPILQIHHIKPLSKNGLNTESNVMLLCPNCHKTIHTLGSNKTESEFDNEYIDEVLDEKYNASQKTKMYLLSLCVDLGKGFKEVEQLVSKFKSERNS